MLKVVVTGGIGSGKSLVCSVFSHLLTPVYNADNNAKALMRENEDIRQGVTRLFGNDSYKGNELNREYLSQKVFSNQEALEAINAIVHPVVMNDFINWSKQFVDKKYVILESALAFNPGVKDYLDRIIVVTAPQELRINRVMQRDGAGRDEILSRMKSQFTEEEMIKYADEIIVNDNKILVVPQVMKIHRNFLNDE